MLAAFPFSPEATSIEWLTEKDLKFSFLNQPHEFIGKVDWNYEGKGKLWNYNLNYFDFLFDPKTGSDSGKKLIKDYCDSYDGLKGGLEPYPISLKGINWIKFLSINNIQENEIDQCLYKQFKILESNLEYHILANHLLENAFSLFFGAYYFENDSFYEKAKKLLMAQLSEQILSDGAHYERSPMYHQILLFRLLDTINLVQNNTWQSKELLEELKAVAQSMLSWLNMMTFRNGEIPCLKDATKRIAPTTQELLDYAKLLSVDWKKEVSLSDSGYRKFFNENMELIVDVGAITPSYQPGHAHADELNFVLNLKGKPFIVDVGISTYEKNQRRQLERSTISHNCVSLGNTNSSEVWGGFRVAKRAKVRLLNDSASQIEAEHTGFEKKGLSVKRKFSVSQSAICIEDILEGSSSMMESTVSILHFHPDVQLKVLGNDIFADKIRIKLEGFCSFALESYEYADGFNRLKEAKKLVLKPSETNQIEIQYAD
ncbi:alginate lyase family protein [Roseivirga sp.]|uniref:alginate lyase family protein n=1 Tax=Roseivirga sp. TaxID=1964215 RepID=UPI002B265716|nr:alginate lyase family protein [Roseivirga sp.]